MPNTNNAGGGDEGRTAKNRFSISDSAAFRKANHDAMEAVKASVAKLKAERDRFFREERKGRGNPDARQASPVDGAQHIRGSEGEGFR